MDQKIPFLPGNASSFRSVVWQICCPHLKQRASICLKEIQFLMRFKTFAWNQEPWSRHGLAVDVDAKQSSICAVHFSKTQVFSHDHTVRLWKPIWEPRTSHRCSVGIRYVSRKLPDDQGCSLTRLLKKCPEGGRDIRTEGGRDGRMEGQLGGGTEGRRDGGTEGRRDGGRPRHNHLRSFWHTVATMADVGKSPKLSHFIWILFLCSLFCHRTFSLFHQLSTFAWVFCCDTDSKANAPLKFCLCPESVNSILSEISSLKRASVPSPTAAFPERPRRDHRRPQRHHSFRMQENYSHQLHGNFNFCGIYVLLEITLQTIWHLSLIYWKPGVRQ